jgi:hypothetical protein
MQKYKIWGHYCPQADYFRIDLCICEKSHRY